MSRCDDNKAANQRIQAQAQAEFDFAQTLEEWGMDTDQFMADLGMSVYDFDVLAHSIYGVNDEDPSVSTLLKTLMVAVRHTQLSKTARTERRLTPAAA